MTLFYHEDNNQAFGSFDTVKEAMLRTVLPIRRQLERNVKNGLPITPAVLAEMKAQIDALEIWLHKLRMEDDSKPARRQIARPTKQITHNPDNQTYEVLPPAKK